MNFQFSSAQAVTFQTAPLIFSKEAQQVIEFLKITKITTSKYDALQRLKLATSLCSYLQKEESKLLHQLFISDAWNQVSGKNKS